MPITSKAQEFIKEGGVLNFPEYAQSFVKPVSKWLGRGKRVVVPVAKGAYYASKAVGKPIIKAGYKGILASGDALYYHPKAALGVAGVSGVALSNVAGDLRKNMQHVDPNNHYTTIGVAGAKVPVLGEINSPLPVKSIRQLHNAPQGYNFY